MNEQEKMSREAVDKIVEGLTLESKVDLLARTCATLIEQVAALEAGAFAEDATHRVTGYILMRLAQQAGLTKEEYYTVVDEAIEHAQQQDEEKEQTQTQKQGVTQ